MTNHWNDLGLVLIYLYKHVLFWDIWSVQTSAVFLMQSTKGLTKPMSDSLIMLKDEQWKRVRSILTPTFSAAKMKEVSATKL